MSLSACITAAVSILPTVWLPLLHPGVVEEVQEAIQAMSGPISEDCFGTASMARRITPSEFLPVEAFGEGSAFQTQSLYKVSFVSRILL